MKDMTPQEVLEEFKRRDSEAIEEYNNFPCLESTIRFIDGRVKDIAAICAYLLQREIDRTNSK